MSQPVIADRKPKAVTLSKGEGYAWCACGLSKNQPYFDGSHARTGLEPVYLDGMGIPIRVTPGAGPAQSSAESR